MTRTRTALVAVAAALLSLSLVSSANAAPQAKLRITEVGHTNGDQIQGSKTLLPGRATNVGTKPAIGRIQVTLAGTETVVGKGRTYKRMKPGKGSDFENVRVKVPDDLAPGSYDLEACVVNKPADTGACMAADSKMWVKSQDPGVDVPDPADPPAACADGSRTLGDRSFPEMGNGGYDAKNYDVFFNYSPVGNTLNTGTRVAMTAVATQDLCRFSLDFKWPAGPNKVIDSITVNGQPATYTQEAPPGGAPTCPVTNVGNSCKGSAASAIQYPPPNGCSPSVDNPPNPGVANIANNHDQCPAMKLVIDPATDIASASTFVVEIAYHGIPGTHRDADGSVEGWAPTQGSDGAFVVNEPIGAYEWMPVNNHPQDKATYDFRLTVPNGKTALGNGELLYYVDNGDGTTTWRWYMGQPMESAMSTTTSGSFDLTSSIAANGVQYYNALDSAFTAAQKSTANVQINQHSTITNFLTTIFGRYPFDSNGVVADNTTGAAINYVLEVQTKIHFPSSSVGLGTLVHETTHQWFGDNVGPSQWHEIWLNEGWATYGSYDYTANFANGTSLASQFNSNYTAGTGSACTGVTSTGGTNKWCIPPNDVDAQNTFTTFPVYTRHATMLIALRQILGTTRFYNMAEEYQARRAGTTMSTAQYFDVILDEAGRGPQGFTGPECDTLEKFLNQWINGTQIDPPYAFGNPSAPTITGTNFWSFVNGGGGASCTD